MFLFTIKELNRKFVSQLNFLNIHFYKNIKGLITFPPYIIIIMVMETVKLWVEPLLRLLNHDCWWRRIILTFISIRIVNMKS